jgi:hypothetical protein
MITFEKFQEMVDIRNPIEVNRRGTMGCDWFFGKTHLAHERTYLHHPGKFKTSGQLFSMAFKQIRSVYWIMESIQNKQIAEKSAAKYGGHVEMEFYCDENNPSWFLIFDDMDKMLRYCYDTLVNNKVIA